MANALDTSRVVAVVGSGAMGAGIAQVAAAAGHVVKLVDARPEAAHKAAHGIAKIFQSLVEKGRMTADASAAASARLQPVESLSALSDATLVVEAIVEDLDAKRALFAELESIVDADCIIASNTSSISITALAAKLRHPGRMVGMHFFNPVPLMALVEVISGLATDKQIAETIYATAAAWGKSPVLAASSPGFIVNRVARPYYGEGLRLLGEQAADVATIDAIMREAGGFRMGPFELMDLIGLDVNYAVTQSVFHAYFNDPRYKPSLIQQELVNAGFLGRKSGRGYYQYGEGAPSVQPHSESPVAAPPHVVVTGAGPIADSIAARLAAKDIHAKRTHDVQSDQALLVCGGATVFLTDGRSATQRARDNGNSDTVLIDLALDYANAKRIALTRADQCNEHAYRAVVGLFQAAGFAVSRLDDVPGMAVMRTVAMLANEAGDAVHQGVCTAQAADIAMLKGVNYPRGPLAWADAIGSAYVMEVLDNLNDSYGEDRYRVSPYIRRKVAAGAKLHD
jgi:3-hydroxybutyryl-CoA dehydrogenase